MIHERWFEPVVLMVLGLITCTIGRRGSNARLAKGSGIAVLGFAGLINWKPEWLSIVALAPAVVAIAAGLLMERDEDRAHKAAESEPVNE